jgi:hypothetical protein
MIANGSILPAIHPVVPRDARSIEDVDWGRPPPELSFPNFGDNTFTTKSHGGSPRFAGWSLIIGSVVPGLRR